MYTDIARSRKGESLASNEFAYEIGKRLTDQNSILRAAYEENVPIFLPPSVTQNLASSIGSTLRRQEPQNTLQVDAFKDVPTICNICAKSPKNGMIVIGGGVPRNTIQSSVR